MREIESGYLLALLDASLGTAEKLGRAHPGDRTVRIHLLFGALCEAAIYMARAEHPKAALARARTEVNRLLDGFEKPAGGRRRSCAR